MCICVTLLLANVSQMALPEMERNGGTMASVSVYAPNMPQYVARSCRKSFNMRAFDRAAKYFTPITVKRGGNFLAYFSVSKNRKTFLF